MLKSSCAHGVIEQEIQMFNIITHKGLILLKSAYTVVVKPLFQCPVLSVFYSKGTLTESYD